MVETFLHVDGIIQAITRKGATESPWLNHHPEAMNRISVLLIVNLANALIAVHIVLLEWKGTVSRL